MISMFRFAVVALFAVFATGAFAHSPPPHERVDADGLATNRAHPHWLFQPACEWPAGQTDVFCTEPASESASAL